MRVLKGHTDAVLCVAYAPDGKTLATGAIDGRRGREWRSTSWTTPRWAGSGEGRVWKN
jgi:WD40 repeat protein